VFPLLLLLLHFGLVQLPWYQCHQLVHILIQSNHQRLHLLKWCSSAVQMMCWKRERKKKKEEKRRKKKKKEEKKYIF
jgi:hypothetical protein